MIFALYVAVVVVVVVVEEEEEEEVVMMVMVAPATITLSLKVRLDAAVEREGETNRSLDELEVSAVCVPSVCLLNVHAALVRDRWSAQICWRRWKT